MTVKVEGFTGDGSDRTVDFSEWSWGDSARGLVKALQDEVAAALWQQIVEDLEGYRPWLNIEDDGTPVLVIGLMDQAHLVVPFEDIAMPDLDMALVLKGGDRDIDIPATLASRQKLTTLLRNWADIIDEDTRVMLEDLGVEA
jgi:hypothetical protein